MAKHTSTPRKVRPRLEQLEHRVLLSATFPDFNGDGFDDLAIGVPFDAVSGVANAGAVNVIYGSSKGLSTVGNQLWSQNSGGMLDRAEAGDNFGSALAWGDFNGDGYDDLAVGVPSEEVNGIIGAGAVHVLYGSRNGLTATGNQFWHQDFGNLQDVLEVNDNFGAALSAGDYNNDGFADLAIGVPGESINGKLGAGAVNVIHGSRNGLSAAGADFFHQDELLGGALPGERFGASLASGDFNGDRRDDLAIGVPNDVIKKKANAGSVNVIYGTNFGLTSAGNQQWYQGFGGVLDKPEKNDTFGFALTSGDFNNDGRDDLAIGVPGENRNAGAVNVLYGTVAGLAGARSQYWQQGREGILDRAERGDQFGYSLAAGDFNSDGIDDLAVGVPREDIGRILNTGAVNIIYGSALRLFRTGNQFWHQDTPGVEDRNENNDLFGFALTAGDYNADGRVDLAVGVPLEDIGAFVNTGAVIAIYGPASSTVNNPNSPTTFTNPTVPVFPPPPGTNISTPIVFPPPISNTPTTIVFPPPTSNGIPGSTTVPAANSPIQPILESQFWWQNSLGIEGEARNNDNFGTALVRR